MGKRLQRAGDSDRRRDSLSRIWDCAASRMVGTVDEPLVDHRGDKRGAAEARSGGAGYVQPGSDRDAVNSCTFDAMTLRSVTPSPHTVRGAGTTQLACADVPLDS